MPDEFVRSARHHASTAKTKTRLFISCDYDDDATLKEFLVGQSKLEDSPFEFTDASVKYHLTGDWETKVKARTKNADQVAVLCGLNTTSSSAPRASTAPTARPSVTVTRTGR